MKQRAAEALQKAKEATEAEKLTKDEEIRPRHNKIYIDN